TGLVVIMLALVTTFVGLRAGIVTALLGGLASWYLFFNPMSWSLANEAWIPVLGYASVAAVILTTSQLYRSSARLHHQKEIERLQQDAETSRLFARELAHRLGNTLAIVQALAVQTIGKDHPGSLKFSGRLKALSDANHLLTEHIDAPTADVAQVIETALKPFRTEREQFAIDSVNAPIQSQQVLALALALHELATNAVKHGALSAPAGLVQVTVDCGGDHLDIVWKERNGPRVEPPARRGFGTRLLARSGTETRLDFESDGVRFSMRMPKAPA
ncbi:MAG TPA: HWE histidine kinase domain-containing protein, partial [Sphingomicrobium sp.]